MLWLILAVIVLGLLTAIGVKLAGKEAETPIVTGSDCSTCTGDNEKCEQECMLEAAIKEIEYYDDEELDSFAGKTSDHYSDEEAETFRDVLYTMRQEEVAGWCRSLTLRGISLPDQIKDEVVMLIGN